MNPEMSFPYFLGNRTSSAVSMLLGSFIISCNRNNSLQGPHGKTHDRLL